MTVRTPVAICLYRSVAVLAAFAVHSVSASGQDVFTRTPAYSTGVTTQGSTGRSTDSTDQSTKDSADESTKDSTDEEDADSKESSDECECDSNSHGTLFQWSYGGDSSGGPDLDEPLVTDRPDFTEASSTVGRGIAQLEMGYTYTFDDDGTTTTKSHSYPEPLLRYGILDDWLELRIGWNYLHEEVAGVSVSGSEDLYLGFKIGLTPQEGILPEMALIPQMTVPTGASAFTADEALPGLNWIYGWEVNDFISTAGSTQFNRAIDDGTGNAYTEWAQSWTIGYSLADRVGAYTEYFGLYPTSADTALPEHYFNGGFTFLINDDIQFDVRAGTGLNDAADDYFAGTGLSIRFQ